MKIVVVSSYAPSLVSFRAELLKAFRACGLEVLALAPDHDDTVAAELHSWGVAFDTFELKRNQISVFGDARAILELRSRLAAEKADYVFSYTIKPVLYGSLAARLARVPHVTSMITGLGHSFGDGSARLRRRLVERTVRALAHVALTTNDTIFFQNPDDLRFFVDAGMATSDQARLVNGSGVDLDLFGEVPITSDHPHFVMVARLIREKGVIEFVEAARRTKARHPDAEFTFVGPADSASPSAVPRELIEEWRAEGVVSFAGATDDVRPFLARSTVYVLPTYREGTPRSVLEAMSMGRAIITTDAPGARETVEDGVNGLLVQPRDVDSLVHAIDRLISDPALVAKLGRASRRLAEERYDVHAVNRTILEAMELSEANLSEAETVNRP